MKKILVVCGSGIATSSTVANRIGDMLYERGFRNKFTIDTDDVKNLNSIISHYDIFINITPKSTIKVDIPTFNGLPFLTGVGKDAVIDEIIKLLN